MNKILFIALLLCSSVVTFAQNDSVKAIVPEQADAAKSVAPATTDSVAKAPKAKKEKKTKTAQTGKSLKVNKELDLKALKWALAYVIRDHKEPVAQDTLPIMLSEQYAKYPEVQTAIAQAYIQNRLPGKALIYIQKANEMSGGGAYAPALHIQGSALVEQQKQDKQLTDSAAVYYEQAIKADSTYKDTYIDYANMYAWLSKTTADEAKQQAYVAKGEAVLERLRNAVPSYDVDLAYVDFYQEAEESDKLKAKSVSLYEEGKLSPTQVAEYDVSLYFNGDYEKGYEVATSSHAKWPDKEDFKRQILWHGSYVGYFKEALESGQSYLNDILALNPDSVDKTRAFDYASFALCYFGLEQNDKAFACFKDIEGIQEHPLGGFQARQVLQRLSTIVKTSVNKLKEQKKWKSAIDLQKMFIDYKGDSGREYNIANLIAIYYAQVKDLDSLATIADTREFCEACEKYENGFPTGQNFNTIYTWHWQTLWKIDENAALPVMEKFAQHLRSKKTMSENEILAFCELKEKIAVYSLKVLNDYKRSEAAAREVLEVDEYSPYAATAKQIVDIFSKRKK